MRISLVVDSSNKGELVPCSGIDVDEDEDVERDDEDADFWEFC